MKMTIYVPTELHKEMQKVPYANWSLIAQQAFAEYIGVIIKPREPVKVIRKKP